MDLLINISVRIAINACTYTHVPMLYKNTTFVNILLIFSHYKPGKPFLKEAPFFWQPPVPFPMKVSQILSRNTCCAPETSLSTAYLDGVCRRKNVGVIPILVCTKTKLLHSDYNVRRQYLYSHRF